MKFQLPQRCGLLPRLLAKRHSKGRNRQSHNFSRNSYSLYALLIMFFLSGKTGDFRVQLARNIAIQRVCEEYDSCRGAKPLFLSSDVFSLRWHGQSVILSWIPLAQKQNIPTNSYAICTLLMSLWGAEQASQRRTTLTHFDAHAHIFHYIKSQANF